MSTFTGFSEEDLRRIKSGATTPKNDSQMSSTNIKKIDKLGAKSRRTAPHYKLPILQTQNSDEVLDNITFEKCRLSIATPTSPSDFLNNNTSEDENNIISDLKDAIEHINVNLDAQINSTEDMTNIKVENDTDTKLDVVRGINNYTEDELAVHRAKLEELQLQQKLMEEQNKKRKEMLAKALAHRTRQTEEEVMKLEKIKKELQVLDGQFSQDVAVIRKKIDQACLSYAEAEKHYLKVEKEFLQAKINLQKEKEKKELLTEHLCALITHNETRKAHKLETLMLELASDRRNMNGTVSDVTLDVNVSSTTISDDDDVQKVIVDGVDQRTGKMMEMNDS